MDIYVSLIIYQIGAGANFLSRVLSLDETTVPVGGYQEGTNFLNVQDRYKKYHYNQVLEYTGKDFNKIIKGNPSKDFNKIIKGNIAVTKWVDYELNHMCFPLTLGIEKLVELDQHIIEPLHLWDYKTKLKLFGKRDIIAPTHYIDCTNCFEWVAAQAMFKSTVKSAKDVRIQGDDVDNYAKQNNLLPIRLEELLYNFEIEYERVCKSIKVKAHTEYALQIFNSWKDTWQ